MRNRIHILSLLTISFFVSLAFSCGSANRYTVSETKITLSWEDNSLDELGFKIERREGRGSYKEIATVGPNVTSYTDAGLSRSTTYYYRIRAYNSAGHSDYTEEIRVEIFGK